MKYSKKDSDDSSVDSDFEVEKPKFNVDTIISQLLSAKVRNAGILTDLKEEIINELIDKAKDLFTAQPVFLELAAPVKIVSDIHG